MTITLSTLYSGTGPQGYQGNQGQVGFQGPGIGDTGAQGPQGFVGPQGVIGPQGVVAPPAGSDTQVQYNDGGSLAASSDMTFNNANGVLSVAGLISGAQGSVFNADIRGEITTLTDGATITIDLSASPVHKVTLGGNRIIGSPSNIATGQSGIIYVHQDATGSRLLTWNSIFKFAGGTVPTLSTGVNAVDAFGFFVRDTSNIDIWQLTADSKI